MDNHKYEIIFVNEFATPLLSAAFDAVSAYENLTVKRLDSLEVISRYSTHAPKRVSFVLCRFEGECFEHLRSIGAAIYGPQIILHYVRENKALPKVSHPLFSTALMGAIATVTSVTGSEREYLFNSIMMLHGEAARDLFDGVNVVITPKVGSKKYLVGANRGLHLLLPGWITEAWRLSAIQDPIDMMLPLHTERFRVPIFCQLVICVSGLSSEERKEVSDLVVKHGGRYSGMMKVGETTHLIIKQAVGLKYSHAKKWKIQIVSLRWLTDSVNRGFALNEEDYRVPEESGNSSTPTCGSMKYSISFNNISAISHSSATSSRIEETRTDYLQADSSLNSRTLPSKILTGCVISLLGCSIEETCLYSKLVKELGGRLCTNIQDQVSESLTHFIFGSVTTDTHVNNHEKGPVSVAGSWLIECKNASRRLPEDAFLVSKGKIGPAVSVREVQTDQPVRPLDNEDLRLINQYFGSDGLAEEDDFTNPTSGHAQFTVVDADTTLNKCATSITEEVNKLGVFSDLSFLFHGELTAKQRDEVGKSLREHGGRIVDALTTADFLVAPFFVRSLPELPNTCKSVTIHWIDQCIVESSTQLERLVMGRAFVPVVREWPLPLECCVISLSGFVGRDRSFLTAYAQSLGAVVQDCFLRKPVPARNLSASTHLIAARRDGRKWPAAQLWGLPAVSRSWLYACADQWKRVNESDFPVPDVLEPVQPHQPLHLDEHNDNRSSEKFKTLYQETTVVTDRVIPRSVVGSTVQSQSLTSALRTPDWIKANQPISIRSESRDSIDRILRPSPPMSEQVARCLKKAVHTTAALPKRRIDLSVCQHPDPLPLKDVVICVAKHMSSRQVELNGIAKQLGGDFKWNYDPHVCTHLVTDYLSDGRYSYEFDQRETTENRDPGTPLVRASDKPTLYSDVNLAKIDGKVIVHPDWLTACLSALRRLPESDFPPSDTVPLRIPSDAVEPTRKIPRLASSDLLGDVNRRLELVLGGSKALSDGCSNESSSASHGKAGLLAYDDKLGPLVDIGNNDEGIPFLTNSPGPVIRRQRRNPRRPTIHTTDLESAAPNGGDHSRNVSNARSDMPALPELASDRAQPGHSLQVRWIYEDAPPRSPSHASGSICTTSSSNTTMFTHSKCVTESVCGPDFAIPREPSVCPEVGSPHPVNVAKDPEKALQEKTKQRVFSFSGLSPDSRDHYASVVNQLGGEVDNQLTISDETTHLIVHTPTRSEKYLICLATGKWILHKSYLDACLRESRWVEESNFEWGGPGTEPLLVQLSPAPLAQLPVRAKQNPQRQQAAQIRELAKAARYWRLAGGKAFQNWRVIFGPGCDKETSFRRVIEAGGGQVLASGPPYPAAATVSHAFYKRRPNASEPTTQLPVEYGWLRIDYLSAYLITGHEVSREEFVLNT